MWFFHNHKRSRLPCVFARISAQLRLIWPAVMSNVSVSFSLRRPRNIKARRIGPRYIENRRFFALIRPEDVQKAVQPRDEIRSLEQLVLEVTLHLLFDLLTLRQILLSHCPLSGCLL